MCGTALEAGADVIDLLSSQNSGEEEEIVQERTIYHTSSRTECLQQHTNWTCGYVNLLMLISPFKDLTLFPALHRENCTLIDTRSIQFCLEAAWDGGFDPLRPQELQGILGTHHWLGATDVATLLRFLNVPAIIVDFEASRFSQRDGLDMFDTCVRWLRAYFLSVWPSGEGAICPGEVFVPPLYFQYSGHSVTIVGMEFNRNDTADSTIFLYDPRVGRSSASCAGPSGSIAMSARRLFAKPSFQFVYLSSISIESSERDLWRIIAAEPHDKIIFE